MDAAARIQVAAEILSTVYPAEHVGQALEDLAAKAARETTSRSATATPLLRWETDRLPDENPAAFAWRAYQPEAQAGTLHRGLISTEDPPLHRKLKNWLRTQGIILAEVKAGDLDRSARRELEGLIEAKANGEHRERQGGLCRSAPQYRFVERLNCRWPAHRLAADA
jgi:hypothetical protein